MGSDRTSGTWLGKCVGLTVRKPGPDADGPIIEVHGSERSAAVEVDEPEFVDKLSRAGVEIGAEMEDDS